MVQAFIRKVLAAMIKLGLFLGVMICAEDTEEWRGRRGGGRVTTCKALTVPSINNYRQRGPSD